MLHEVDLDLRPGETLAIVGPSSAGKSTFGRMLAGVHPPAAGRVTVGGVPLVDLTEDELRRNVVLVTQEHHVFVGTIADNIRLACADATDDQIRRADHRAGHPRRPGRPRRRLRRPLARLDARVEHGRLAGAARGGVYMHVTAASR